MIWLATAKKKMDGDMSVDTCLLLKSGLNTMTSMVASMTTTICAFAQACLKTGTRLGTHLPVLFLQ